MIVLNNGDKIRGDASVASVVDYTFHGLAGSVISQLADGQLADSTGDLYTAGAIVVVSSVALVNTHSTAITLNLYLLPSGGTARRLLAKDFILGIGYSLHYDGVKINVLSSTGAIVRSYIAHASSHTDGTDDIQSATNTQKGLATAAQITALEAAIANVSEDTTPQFGGDLEYNSKNLVFNNTLSSDETASGDIITVTFGEAVVFGKLCYPDAIDDEWKLALGTNVAVKHPALGVALETKGNGETGKLLLRGLIRSSTYFSAFTLGLLYLSDGTAGLVLDAAPVTTGDIVQIVGWCPAANYMFFNPDKTWIEVS